MGNHANLKRKIEKSVFFLPQEPSLFSCSIADNIVYGAVDTDVTRDQIMEAAKMANAQDFIQHFPAGLDTLVGERGVMLSGNDVIPWWENVG